MGSSWHGYRRAVLTPMLIPLRNVLLLLALCAPTIAAAVEVKLAWDPSPSPEVAGYELLAGEAPGTSTLTADAGTALAFTLTGLQNGKTYYVRVRAYSAGKTVYSPDSNEVSRTFILILQAPINLRVVP